MPTSGWRRFWVAQIERMAQAGHLKTLSGSAFAGKMPAAAILAWLLLRNMKRWHDIRRNVLAVLAAGISVLAGCGGSPGYLQAVPGTFEGAGGPAPGSPFPLPGTITARAATGQTFTATAGRDGRFTLSLPPGTYQVTGRSPLMQSGQMTCPATAELRVARGTPAGPVTVVCSIR